MRRRTGIIAWLIVIVAVAALLLAWQYLDYRSAGRMLPAGMTMASLAGEGMTREEALVSSTTPKEVLTVLSNTTLPGAMEPLWR